MDNYGEEKVHVIFTSVSLGKRCLCFFFVRFNLANSALFLPGLYSKNLATHLAFWFLFLIFILSSEEVSHFRE